MLKKYFSKYKEISYLLNISFICIILWYFCIHIGFDYYLDKYVKKKELFLVDLYYEARVQAYRELNLLHKDNKKYVVFVGDSIIEQFPVNELFPQNCIINRGLGYDTSNGILKRIDKNINNININKCFIMVGHNDLKYRTVEETYEKITKILVSIKATKKYFISILPSDDIEVNQKKEKLNNMIQKYCDKKQINYIDIYSKFRKNHSIKYELYYDGVHLNMKGYMILYKKIEKLIDYRQCD